MDPFSRRLKEKWTVVFLIDIVRRNHTVGSPRGRLWADVFIPQSGRPGAVHECLKVVTVTRSARLGQSPCAPFCFWAEFATRLSPYWSLSGFRGLPGIRSRFSTATALVVTTWFSLPDCVRGKCHFDDDRFWVNDDRFWVSVAVTFKKELKNLRQLNHNWMELSTSSFRIALLQKDFSYL